MFRLVGLSVDLDWLNGSVDRVDWTSDWSSDRRCDCRCTWPADLYLIRALYWCVCSEKDPSEPDPETGSVSLHVHQTSSLFAWAPKVSAEVTARTMRGEGFRSRVDVYVCVCVCACVCVCVFAFLLNTHLIIQCISLPLECLTLSMSVWTRAGFCWLIAL